MKVLDASALIAAQRGSESAREKVSELLRQSRDVVLPTIALLEFRSGSRVAPKWRRWLESLQTAFQVAPLDEAAARLGGRYARQLARRGYSLRPADAAVIGCGAARGAFVIVTADGDFDRLPAPFTVERVAPK